MHILPNLIFADGLAPWGNAAAIVLAIYLFVSLLVGLGLTVALVFAFAWVREKAELIKKLRPTVDVVNKTIVEPENAMPIGKTQERLVQIVQRVQAVEIPQKFERVQQQVHSVGVRVERQTDRVAETMIEVRARTEMVKGILKAFFLPGLIKRDRLTTYPRLSLPETTDGIIGIAGPVPGADEQQLVEVGHERLR